MTSATVNQVFLSTYHEQRNKGTLLLTWAIFGLGLIAGAMPFFALKTHTLGECAKMSVMFFTFFLCGNVIMWWASFIANIIRLCAPQHAQLLPNIRQSAAAAYFAAWLASSLLVATLFAIAAGHYFLFFLGAGFLLLFITIAWGLGNWLVAIPFYFSGMWMPHVKEWVIKVGLWDGSPSATFFSLALLTLTFGIVVFKVFRTNGDNAFKMQVKLRQRKERLQNGWSYKNPGWQLQLNGKWLYDTNLNRLTRLKTKVTSDNVTRFLRYGFGPSLHWSCISGAILSMIGVIIAIKILPNLFPELGMVMAFSGNALFGFFIVVMNVTAGTAAMNAIFQTQREQALLLLLPAVPQRGALNRAVMRLMLFHFMTMLLLSFLSTLFLIALMQNKIVVNDLKTVSVGVVAALPVGVIMLGNYSKMNRPALISFLMTMFSFLLCTGFIVLLRSEAPAEYLIAAMGIVTFGTVGIWTMRWRQSGNLPTVLPAHRMSKGLMV